MIILDRLDKRVLKYGIWAIVGILGIRYFNNVLTFIGSFWNVALPLIIGLIIAYVLNMIVTLFESRFPKMKRTLSITLSLILIFGIIALTTWIVVPQFTDACIIIKDTVPQYFTDIKTWFLSNKNLVPEIANKINSLEIDWDKVFQKVVSFMTNNTGTLLSTTFSLIGSVTVGIFHFVIGLIFAVYVLANKEKIFRRTYQLVRSSKYTTLVDKFISVVKTSNECFSNFIIGQCKEALILGILCAIGMLIICPRYALMIGVLIGITAFIPILGAYLGAIVGAFVVFTVEPIKAVYFLIFIVVLQQIEGHLIYPKVVGETIGVPGILVFTAVILGGNLAGFIGIMLGVPIMAVVYQFATEYLNSRYPEDTPQDTQQTSPPNEPLDDTNSNSNSDS